MGHLRILDFVALGIYALAMLLIGWWSARRQKSTEEYFVASRGIGSFVVGISMIATLLSTISYLATPGEIIKHGPGYMWGLTSAPISFLVVGYLVIPRIMRHKITSGYELLEDRFGMNIRQTASIRILPNNSDDGWLGGTFRRTTRSFRSSTSVKELQCSVRTLGQQG